jgi:alkylhydroperoxidase family enzyme
VAWSCPFAQEVVALARRHQRRFDRFERRVLDGPGRLDSALRRAAFGREVDDLPEAARVYVAKIHDHAFRITDGDVGTLLAAGYTEDQVFELTVAAAAGAGLQRLKQARQAMGGG